MTLKELIKSLLTAANATTGKSDTNLTEGVQSLIAGYGTDHQIIDAMCRGENYEIHTEMTAPFGTRVFVETNISAVFAPNCTGIGDNSFRKCSSLGTIEIPNAEYIKKDGIYGSKVSKLEFNNLQRMDQWALEGNTNLVTIIIRTPSVCTIDAETFYPPTPVLSGTGYVYVPKNLVEQYKSATNWVKYANQIRAIEDYPEITGGAK